MAAGLVFTNLLASVCVCLRDYFSSLSPLLSILEAARAAPGHQCVTQQLDGQPWCSESCLLLLVILLCNTLP